MAGLSAAIVGKRQRRGPVLMLLAVAFGAMIVAVLARDHVMRLSAVSAALTMMFLIAGLKLRQVWTERRNRERLAQLISLVGNDAAPCYLTDRHGQILYQNLTAVSRFKADSGGPLVSALNQHFASPSSVLYRLQNRALHSGFGREDVVTRRGHTRLAVHKISEDQFLWRLEEFQERGIGGAGRGKPEPADADRQQGGRGAVHQ